LEILFSSQLNVVTNWSQKPLIESKENDTLKEFFNNKGKFEVAGVAQLVKEGFCKPENTSQDLSSEDQSVDDKDKKDYISDLMGEKLDAIYVQALLKRTFRKHNLSPTFYMVAPENAESNRYLYSFFIEINGVNDNKLRLIRYDIEMGLCDSFRYDYCGKLGQLHQVRVFAIDKKEQSPADLYLQRHISKGKGKKMGSIKSLALDKNVGWSKVFHGRYIDA